MHDTLFRCRSTDPLTVDDALRLMEIFYGYTLGMAATSSGGESPVDHVIDQDRRLLAAPIVCVQAVDCYRFWCFNYKRDEWLDPGPSERTGDIGLIYDLRAFDGVNELRWTRRDGDASGYLVCVSSARNAKDFVLADAAGNRGRRMMLMNAFCRSVHHSHLFLRRRLRRIGATPPMAVASDRPRTRDRRPSPPTFPFEACDPPGQRDLTRIADGRYLLYGQVVNNDGERWSTLWDARTGSMAVPILANEGDWVSLTYADYARVDPHSGNTVIADTRLTGLVVEKGSV